MRRGGVASLWAWPVALGLATGFGLIAALLADGLWDLLSGAALAAPLIVGGRCLLRARPAHPVSGLTAEGSC